MAAAASGEGELCDDCFRGAKLDGTPKGSESRIGPFNTYVAKPEGQIKDDKAAIIFFYDAFGLKVSMLILITVETSGGLTSFMQLVNNKLLPDIIAEKTGLTVYVPDIFAGSS
jgi:carboxymethylenebutenolidase